MNSLRDEAIPRGPSDSEPRRLATGIPWSLVLVVLLVTIPPAGDQTAGGQTVGVRSIEILGNDTVDEEFQYEWVAVLAERAIETSTAGYRPTVRAGESSSAGLPTDWERPLEVRWNFGDGSGWLPTGERPSIAHTFADDGDFTLTVEAWHEGLLLARGEKSITVRNKRPRAPLLGAIQTDPDTNTIEFTALVSDAEDETILYRWDFGDGEIDEGPELWKTSHAYGRPGTYTVTLRVSDDDDPENTVERSRQVVVAGAGAPEAPRPVDTPSIDVVETAFQARVSGSVGFEFTGVVRPLAGIYLGPIDRGRRCRFMFTAWDDAHLAHLNFILDLPARPEPGGARYRLRRPFATVNLERDAEGYEGAKKFLLGRLPGGSLGASPQIAGLGEGLSPELRRRIAELTGFEPGPARENPFEGATPATSPFGVDAHQGFEAVSGQVDLLFVPGQRATGTFEVVLHNTAEKSAYPALSLAGEFALDLVSARRDGILLYDQCNASDFSIKSTTPEDGRRHVLLRNGRVGVTFSEPVDDTTLDDSRFQLTYPAAGSGEPVPVPARLYRSPTFALLEPERPLLGGVTYTARVRTGADGVRSNSGGPLEDADGTGWHTWSFTSLVDLVAGPGGENLACHVHQSVRDAPLIAGKPAVARIYADWKAHPQVAASAQVEEFTARVSLMRGDQEIASVPHRFVRPDLWSSRGIDQSNAEHTANVFWTPEEGLPSSLRVGLEVPLGIDDQKARFYWTRCATPIWSLAPEIRIAWFLVDAGPWHERASTDTLVEVERFARRVVESSRTFVRQLFPFKEVHVRFGGILRPGRLDALTSCSKDCATELVDEYRGSLWPTDHAGLGFVPHIEGGHRMTGGAADRDRPGTFAFAIAPRDDYVDRYVSGVVHELGHVLGLEHLPYTADEFQQAEATRVRNESWAQSAPVLWHGGIEGFRISSDGRAGWNKSSTEGNEQGAGLTNLMYPATVPIDEVFIARHHYLLLMRRWESAGGMPNP